MRIRPISINLIFRLIIATGSDSVIPIVRQFPVEDNERSGKGSMQIALLLRESGRSDQVDSFLPSFFSKHFLIAHMHARRIHMRALDRAWIRADAE